MGMTPVAARPTSRSIRFLTRHQVAVFVLLTMIVSWAFVPVADGGLLPQGPMIAAFVVLGLVSGRRGVAELWRQMREWRVSGRWYLIAPSIFLGVLGVALILASSVGLQVATPSAVWTLSALLATAIPLSSWAASGRSPGGSATCSGA